MKSKIYYALAFQLQFVHIVMLNIGNHFPNVDNGYSKLISDIINPVDDIINIEADYKIKFRTLKYNGGILIITF